MHVPCTGVPPSSGALYLVNFGGSFAIVDRVIKLKLPTDKKLYLGLGPLAVLLVIGSICLFNTVQFIDASRRVSDTHHLLSKLENILALVTDAESAGRGYALTGDENLLTPYRNAAASINREMDTASILVRGNAAQKERMERLRPWVVDEFNSVRKVITLRTGKDLKAAQHFIEGGKGIKLTEKIRTVISEMQEEEKTFLGRHAGKEDENARHAVRVIIIGNFAALLFTAASILILFGDIAARRQVENQLKEASKKLQIWVEDLEQRNREFSILSETVDLLHTCVTPEEAYGIISRSCQRLFPGMQGALYLINDTKNLVEMASEWNGPLPGEAIFEADNCWALRRGRLYECDSLSGEAVCGHLNGMAFERYFCIPMMGQGAALGFLHLRYSKDSNGATTGEFLKILSESAKRLVSTFAEQAALALANLKLRETLRNQSVHAPLTGLFNRRYLRDTLEKELRRAARGKKSLGLIMMDIDHFKKFNDSFGHDAGDQLLVELGQHIQKQIRDYDVPCRYGGEEFMILLPEASLEVVQKRAEQLRKSVKHIQLQYKGELMGPVSLSLGVAIFPQHGQTLENLFRAADNALYQAKSEGRNCVMIAEAVTVSQR